MEQKEIPIAYTPQKAESTSGSLKPFPGFVQALRIMLTSYLVIIPVAVVTGLILSIINIKLVSSMAKLMRIDIAAIIVLAYFYKKRIKVSTKEAFFLNRFSPWILIPIAITVLGLGIILSEIDNLFRLVLPMPQFIQDIYTQYLFNRQSMLASIISVAIFGPITEELMFRGMILHGFLGRYRYINAIILSSLLFAFMHVSPWQLIGAFVYGCFFGWILVKTRSLYPCIIAHAFNNFIPCIIFYSGIEIPGYSGEVMPTNIFQPLWFDLCGILLILLGIMILRRQFGNKLI